MYDAGINCVRIIFFGFEAKIDEKNVENEDKTVKDSFIIYKRLYQTCIKSMMRAANNNARICLLFTLYKQFPRN